MSNKYQSNERKARQPNLATILMVEDFLRTNNSQPLKFAEIKKRLPKKVMHQTLLTILDYLWQSNKIIFSPKGIQWIYSTPPNIKKTEHSEKISNFAY